MNDRSEVLTGLNPAGDVRLIAAYGLTPRVTPAHAEDVVDPCHAADADVRPDPFDGGCPADNTPAPLLGGNTDGRTDAPLPSAEPDPIMADIVAYGNARARQGRLLGMLAVQSEFIRLGMTVAADVVGGLYATEKSGQ